MRFSPRQTALHATAGGAAQTGNAGESGQCGLAVGGCGGRCGAAFGWLKAGDAARQMEASRGGVAGLAGVGMGGTLGNGQAREIAGMGFRLPNDVRQPENQKTA